MPTPLTRVFEVTRCRTQTELADFLGIKQSSIALAKKKGKIPAEWLLTLWRKTGVNPDWILKGEGAKGLQFVECNETFMQPTVHLRARLTPNEYTMEELLGEVIRRAAKSMCMSDQEEREVKHLLSGGRSGSSR